MLVTEEIIQTNFDIFKFQDKDYLFSDMIAFIRTRNYWNIFTTLLNERPVFPLEQELKLTSGIVLNSFNSLGMA